MMTHHIILALSLAVMAGISMFYLLLRAREDSAAGLRLKPWPELIRAIIFGWPLMILIPLTMSFVWMATGRKTDVRLDWGMR